MSKRELLLLRHAKSDWDTPCDDFSRPLKKRGKQAAERIGAWLKNQALLPDHWWCSPAVRTCKTAERVARALDVEAPQLHFDEGLYLASAGQLLEILKQTPATCQRVLLVGHNPGLEELLLRLLKDQTPPQPDGKLLPTATVARLAILDSWANLGARRAKLLSITRPATKQKYDAAPVIDGIEYRYQEPSSFLSSPD